MIKSSFPVTFGLKLTGSEFHGIFKTWNFNRSQQKNQISKFRKKSTIWSSRSPQCPKICSTIMPKSRSAKQAMKSSFVSSAFSILAIGEWVSFFFWRWIRIGLAIWGFLEFGKKISKKRVFLSFCFYIFRKIKNQNSFNKIRRTRRSFGRWFPFWS